MRPRPTVAVLLCTALLSSACQSSGGRIDDSQGLPDATVHRTLAGAVEYRTTSHYSTPRRGQETPLARAERDLAVALLHRLAGAGGNVSVSPASLGLALAMLENGAVGATRSEIAAASQASGLSAEQQNAGWLALTRSWAAATRDGSVTLSSANSLWVQRGFPLAKQFMTDLAGYYDTGVWQADFGKGSTASDAINRWTSEQTRGRITKLFDHLDPETVLVLANAIYFKAAWATPFDAGRTTPGPFIRADGSTVPARFLTDDETTRPAAITPDYSAVQLPYRGGRFAALAVMPTKQSLPEFVGGLTTARLDAIVAALHPDAVDLALPKFTTTSKLDLKPVLQALGMRQAFTDSADLTDLSTRPTKVDQVVQRVYLAVAEKGTEAAAATGISAVPTSARPAGANVRFDHPFLFLIRDTVTGAILFATQVVDPMSS